MSPKDSQGRCLIAHVILDMVFCNLSGQEDSQHLSRKTVLMPLPIPKEAGVPRAHIWSKATGRTTNDLQSAFASNQRLPVSPVFLTALCITELTIYQDDMSY